MNPDRFLSLLIISLVGLVLFTTPSPAQMMGQSTSNEDSSAPTQQSADPDLISVEQTFKTFLQAFPNSENDMKNRIVPEATKTIQFPNELISEEQKRTLAIQLKGVIDRIEKIDYMKVAREAGEDRYVFHRLDSGSIALEKNERGEWLFTEQTINALQDMWNEVENREVVAGVESYDVDTIGEKIRDLFPASFRNKVVFLEGWQWLGIFTFIVIGIIADRLLILFLVYFISLGLKRINVNIDRAEKFKTLRPLGLLAMAAVWYFGVYSLLLPLNVVTVFSLAVRFVAALSFVWAAYKLVDTVSLYLERKAEKTETKVDDLIIPFFRKIAKAFVVAFGLVFIAQQLNVDVTSLLAGLGLGGLAFALAAKDTLENVFGSLTVLIDHPFSVGDWIAIEGVCDGHVELVGLRSTRVRTFYNSLITVPNSTLIKTAVDNYGRRQFRRWSTTLSLTYDTPPEKIEAFTEGLREIIKLHPYTRKDYYPVYANNFGAHSLDILLYVFFETPDWATELRERHRLFLDILRLAEKIDVEFAFPTQTIHIPKELPSHDNKPKSSRVAHFEGRHGAHEILRREYGNIIPKPDPVKIEIPEHLDLEEQERYLRERMGGGE
jgi:MscS family membrane protein